MGIGHSLIDWVQKIRWLVQDGAPQLKVGLYTITKPLLLFNIAMENCPFMDDFPIKTSIYKGFSMAMLNNQMVTIVLTCINLQFSGPRTVAGFFFDHRT